MKRSYPAGLVLGLFLLAAPGARAQALPPHPGSLPLSEPQHLAELDFQHCRFELLSLGVAFERLDPTAHDDPQCGIARPVRVTMPAPGVRLTPPGIMQCETARALARWVSLFVLPASGLLPERGPIAALTQSSTHVCRPVNNLTGGDLSEHAYGNAIDIREFRFAAGPPVAVEPRERQGTPAEAFQDAVRAAACLTFTTVIGPGTDAAHADHLHLDVKRRRGGFRLCQ